MTISCPKCQSNNTETSRFCAECGTKLHSDDADQASVTKTINAQTAGSMLSGRYRILEKLGEGGMGVVYKAEDLKLKRCVAIKFLPPELMRDTEAKVRFVREAQATAALSHPNICTIHEIDEDEEKSFIVMEYVEGQSLREKLKSGPLNVDGALDIAIQVAGGLEKAHAKGIIHRDVKSANIMITGSGQAKIMDFGLAKVMGASLITKEAKTMGTVAYMSPEQAEGKAVDHRTDIWSLGVVLYEMLSGQLPFKGEHEQSLIYAILKKEVIPLTKHRAEIPNELENVVATTLAKNPSDRYQKVEELLADLRAVDQGMKPIKAKARPFLKRLFGEKKAYFIAGVAVLTALIIFGVFVFFPGRGEALDSIAVLPLVNYSGDPEQDYFSDSLTDMLTADLYKLSNLRVIPPQYVRAYKNSDKTPKEIARELGVKAIVQASVLKSENKVRLIARLIDPTQNKQIWAETFEREISDIFFLQSELSQAIVSGIKIVVSPEEKTLLARAHKVNPEAYDLFLKGYNTLWFSQVFDQSDRTYRKALDYYSRAVQIDPSFALAYSYIGTMYFNLGVTSLMPQGEAYAKSRQATQKALELDEKLAEPHVNLGLIKLLDEWDFAGAEKEYSLALQIEPGNIFVQFAYIQFINFIGRFEEAIQRQKRLEETAPPGFLRRLAHYYVCAGRYDEGLEEAKEEFSKDQGADNKLFLEWAYEMKGLYPEALSLMKEIMALPDKENEPEMLTQWGRILALSGRREEALMTMEKIKSVVAQRNNNPAIYLAAIYAALGDKDRAFELLNEAYEIHTGPMHLLIVYPWFHSLHDDPRYHELVRKMGFLT